MTENEPRVRVGTSGWKKPMWRGNFYRRRLVQKRELEYASSRLSSLEINTTFHGLARPSSYQNWRSETPDDFVFAVKGNKVVTHDHRLRNAQGDVANFLGWPPIYDVTSNLHRHGAVRAPMRSPRWTREHRRLENQRPADLRAL